MGPRGARGGISGRSSLPHAHTCCHDLNLVNTLKSYYDHISRGPTVRFTSTGKHSLFLEKQ